MIRSNRQPIILSDFTTDTAGIDIHDGQFLFPYSSQTRIALEIQNLDPAREYEIEISFTQARYASSGKAYIRVQNQLYNFGYGQTLAGTSRRFTLDLAAPLTVEIQSETDYSSRCGARIFLYSTGSMQGTNRVCLLAHTPRPEYGQAVLGKAVLGAFNLPDQTRTSEWFTLGQTRLGYGILSEKKSLNTWKNISNPATDIEYTRGVAFNGFTCQGQIGTLTARIYNALDPRASNLIHGTPIKLIDSATRRTLFTGKISKTISTQEKTAPIALRLPR
ncbi:hypothetical protein RQN30_10735 [Arcanobacterium hippocoleae]